MMARTHSSRTDCDAYVIYINISLIYASRNVGSICRSVVATCAPRVHIKLPLKTFGYHYSVICFSVKRNPYTVLAQCFMVLKFSYETTLQKLSGLFLLLSVLFVVFLGTAVKQSMHCMDYNRPVHLVLGLISKRPLDLKFAAPPCHHRFHDFLLLFGL